MFLTIEIDCAPGTQRPDKHFSNILEIIGNSDNTKINKYISLYKSQNKDLEPYSTLFGNWIWKLNLKDYEYSVVDFQNNIKN